MQTRRDGVQPSVWTATQEAIEGRGETGQTADIIIAGAGITGLSLALLLQKAGKKVIVLEAENPGFGTTGGTSAHINTFLDTTYGQIAKDFGEDASPKVAQMVREACNLIRENVHAYQIDCDYRENTGYLFSVEASQQKELENIVTSAKSAGVKVDFINDSSFPIPYTKMAVWPDQAQFHPLRYLYGLAEAFAAIGGVMKNGVRVESQKREGEFLVVHTNKEAFKTRDVVYATHIPPGINLLHLRCAPYRSYIIAVTLNGKYPDAMGYDMNDPYHYYRTEVIDGKSYFIVGGEDHKTGHEENTDKHFRALEAHTRSFFDVASVDFRWSSQYFEPTDGLPYIGHLPGADEHVYVATGFGGNGIIHGSSAALILSRHLLGMTREEDKIFSPSRLKPVAGFTSFVEAQADVALQLIKAILPNEKLEELSALARGEGKVVKWEGHSLAIYKDDNGAISALNPLCPHMKCSVAWNSSERSWDCPCHGSRFGIDGAVLTGPATTPLTPVDLRN